MKRVAGKTQITYPYILYSFCCVLRALGIMLQKRRCRLQNGLKRNLIRGEPICWKITTPSFNDCADGILLLGRSLETKYGNFFEVRFWADL